MVGLFGSINRFEYTFAGMHSLSKYIFRKNSAYVCRPPLSIRTTASSALHTIQNQFASRWTRIMGYLSMNNCDTILLLKVVTHMNLPFRPKRFIYSLCSFMEASFQVGLQTLFGNQMAFLNESVETQNSTGAVSF